VLGGRTAPSAATAVSGWLAGLVLFRYINDSLFPFRASFYLGTHFGRSPKNTRVVYF
jgi:hypothetical protein